MNLLLLIVAIIVTVISILAKSSQIIVKAPKGNKLPPGPPGTHSMSI